jgi:hypothetical protein
MRHVTLPLSLLGALACAVPAAEVVAATIKYRFTAVVSEAEDLGSGLLSGVVSVGDVFEGVLSYDSELPDTAPDDAERGAYGAQPLGVNQLVFSSSTFDYAASDGEFALAAFDVFFRPTEDLFRPAEAAFVAEVNGEGTPDFRGEPGIDDVLATLYLSDRDVLAFASDALPTGLKLADFQGPNDRAELEIVGFDELNLDLAFRVVATVTQLQAVPEPASAALVLCGLLFRPRRRR